jgi:hypothetical protein
MISNRQLDKIAKEIVNIGSKFVDIQYKIEHCVPPVPHLFVKGIILNRHSTGMSNKNHTNI